MRKTLRMLLFMFLAFVGLGLSTAFAQTGTVSGVVSDKQTGEVLPGANVYIEGTTTGVSTDVNGKYTLQIPVGSQVIVCSYIGYQKLTSTLEVSKGQIIVQDFAITEDNLQLDEVVVVGYGTERKRNITSSITSVKSAEIANIPVENFGKALQGRTPGVMIKSDNGLPGGAVTFRIRGTSSILASSEPLYVVDGVPAVSGSFTDASGFPDKSNVLAQIDPGDIASIEILKDASAAAIYGARSANGVVLITTKQGKMGEGKQKTNINFDYYAGWSQETRRLSILDASQYLALTKEAYFNSYPDKTEEDYYKNLPYGIYNADMSFEQNKQIIDNYSTNWLDEALHKGFLQNASLSASGGGQKTQFFISGSYYGEDGFIIDNRFQRINGRINLTHTASERFKFGGNVGLSYTINNRVPTGWAGGLGTAQSRSLPIMPVYDSLGGYFAPKASNGTNIVASRNDLDYSANTFSVIGNFFAEFNFTKWLSVREEFGLNNIYLREYKYEGPITHDPVTATDRRINIESYTNLISLNAAKTFNSKHNITALAGLQVTNSNQYGVSLTGQNFPNPALQQPGSASIITGTNWTSAYGFLSIIGRATYAYDDKYYVTISLRDDASSRFGPDSKWGLFPAASIGWTVTEEKFMPKSLLKVLTYFKLRASYGLTGNAEIGEYQYLNTYSAASYNGAPAIRLNTTGGDPKLHWEQTAQTDVGIDFGLWQGRISGGFDYYYKNTSDMLLNVNVPQTSGISRVMTNVGTMDNQGIEMFITTNNLVKKFKWQTEFNLSHNKNKILDIEGQIIAGENFGNNYAQEGYPVGAWRLVQYYGVDPETGKELFVLNDGSIGFWDDSDPNFFADNAKIVGNPYPTWFGGINNIFSWKGFDASVLITYQWGCDVYRDDGKFLQGGSIGANWNQMTTIENRWQKPGDIAETPQLLWNNFYSNHNSTRYLDDGSFVRLKTVTIGYTIPSSWSKKIGMNSVRVFFNAQNWVLIWTNYTGWDPEVNRDVSGNITQGVTYLSPPQGKTFTFGVNLNL